MLELVEMINGPKHYEDAAADFSHNVKVAAGL